MKKHHWSDRVLETVVSKINISRQSPDQPKNAVCVKTITGVEIIGGAEYGKFPYFSNTNQEKVCYHSGKIYNNDLLLEVNGQTVAGLTLYDLQTIISSAEDPLKLKHVRETNGIKRDLKKYLGQRFERDSIDFNLQALIRDNLYLRTLPCTTRPPRDDEKNGVDYQFLSVEEFQELGKNGELLESGMFENNYYGTPRPPKEPPLEDDEVDQFPVVEDGKENTARMMVMNGIEKMDMKSSGSREEFSLHLSPKQNSDQEPDLPVGWERARTDSGTIYYIDHNTQKTSWQHPKEFLNNENAEPERLPEGWEKISDPELGTYYIDHVNQRTTYEPPQNTISPPEHNHTQQHSQQINNSLPQQPLENNNNNSLLLTQQQVQPASPKHQPQQQQHQPETTSENPFRKKVSSASAFTPTKDITTDSQQNTTSLTQQQQQQQQHPVISSPNSLMNLPFNLQGDLFDIVIKKADTGFGFTIIGGDEPDELIQVKAVVSDQTILLDQVQPGDVIVAVNDEIVVGWPHKNLVNLFKNIPVGSSASIKLCRGYPLPTEEEEADEYGGNITPNNFDYGREFGYDKSSINRPAIVTKKIVKGPGGFGFNFSQEPDGSFIIKNIQPGVNFGILCEGDQLLRVDHRPLPGTRKDIIELFSRYAENDEVLVTIQRENNTTTDEGKTSPEHHQAAPSATTPVVPNIQTVFPDRFIYLTRKESGFGFRIKQGNHKTTIGEIIPGGAASEEGSLKDGDELVSVDGVYVQGMSHNEVIKLMHSAVSKGTVTLGIRKPRSGRRATGSSHGGPPPSSDSDLKVVNLSRSHNEGFGFVVITNAGLDENIHRIGNIIAGSPAGNCKQLKVDDRIVSVNNQMLKSLEHNEVVNLIREAGTTVQLGVYVINTVQGMFEKRASGTGSQDIICHVGDIYEIVIPRGANGSFGFGLRGGSEYGMRLYVLRLAPGGPANSTNPQMMVGDRLLSINNSDCEENTLMSHAEAISLIRSGGAQLHLKLVRGDGTVPIMPNSATTLSNRSNSSSLLGVTHQ